MHHGSGILLWRRTSNVTDRWRTLVLGVMLMTWWIGLGSTVAAPAPPFSTAGLDTVLTVHLRKGRVDYGTLARDRGPLDRFLASTRSARPDEWSRNEQIAFWANVYNARVLEGVIRRPGLKSVLDVGKKLGVPTLGFFREKSVVAGRSLSLNDIEHKILRQGFREPRLHFVLNCASASCPLLPARALTGESLDEVLDEAAAEFLADRARNPLVSSTELRLSSIFKWYRADFESDAGSLTAFVERYRKGGEPIRKDASVRFVDYDWSLNGHW